MGDDITIGVTEIVNNIEVTAQPNDQIVDISVVDNADDVTLNITPTVIEININKGSSYAKWGDILGTLSDQTDLQAALDLKANLVGGKVPASELPSYVDDVVEVADYAALPTTGETGKIYVTLDNNKIYRWSGSIYIEIAANSAIWGAITGTLSSQTDLQNALNAKFNNPTGNTTQYIAGDGSLITFPIAGQSGTLVREVRNTTGATLLKGTVVYINGATGNKPTIAKAIATGDSTSAQTFGMLQADISNNANGYVVCVGDIIGLDTSAITEGTQLYLSSTTAGAYTSTKQLAPAHLVYIGVVTRSHPTLGQIEVKIQNGYELDEIHDVSITSKANNQFLVYESATDLWKNKSFGTVLGGTSSQFVKGDGSLDSTAYVPTARTLTINGTAYDLTADRSWTITAGVWGQITGTLSNQTDLQTALDAKQTLDADLTAIAGLSGNAGLLRKTAANTWVLDLNVYATTSQLHDAVTIGTANGLSLSNQVLSLGLASAAANGALSTADWTTFNNKQTALNGTGIVRFSGVTPSYISGTNNQFVKGDGSLDSNTYITAAGANTFTNQVKFDNDIFLKQDSSLSTITGYTTVGADTNGVYLAPTSTKWAYLDMSSITTYRNYTFPDYTGTFLLANASGNVGINTTAPLTSLTVNGNLSLFTTNQIRLYNSAKNNWTQIDSPLLSGDTEVDFRVLTKTGSFYINASGNVGIGTTSPDNGKLTILKATSRATESSYAIAIQSNASNVYTELLLGADDTVDCGIIQTAAKNTSFTTKKLALQPQGGNVGIGTTAPLNKLHVDNGGIRLSDTTNSNFRGITFGANATDSTEYAYIKYSPSTGEMRYWANPAGFGGFTSFYSNNAESMRITSGGDVGIGYTSPTAKLNVAGNIHIGDYGSSATRVFETRTSTNLFSITTYPTNADGTFISYSWANGGQGPLRFGNASSVVLALTASGNVLVPTLGTGLVYSNSGTLTSTNPSDSRLKDNIVSLNYGLNEILKLRPVSYNWKNDEINQGKQFGFIAQEVQEVMPELVKEFQTEDGERLGLDKEGIYAALVNAIQELKAEIEILKNK